MTTRIYKHILATALILIAGFSAQAQSSFQNLNFEQANPIVDPRFANYPVPYNTSFITETSALPDWTAYVGNVQQTDVWQNFPFSESATFGIFGPNHPATSTQPGSIDGHYSAFLEADSSSQQSVTASIEQMGTIPVGSESLQFKVWQSMSPNSAVSFDGINLSPVILGTGSDYTLYGADISTWAGQTGQLAFTLTTPETGSILFGIDDIAFSPASVVPEPSIMALSAIGGLLFGPRKFLARSC